MGKVNLVNNIIYSVLTTIISGTLNSLYPLLIGLIFVKEVMGRYSLIYSWIIILSIPILNGIGPAISRFIASGNTNERVYFSILGLKLSLIILTIVSIIFLPLGVLIPNQNFNFFELLIIIILFSSMSIHNSLRRILEGYEFFKNVFKIELIGFLNFLIAVFLTYITLKNNITINNVYLLFISLIIFHVITIFAYILSYKLEIQKSKKEINAKIKHNKLIKIFLIFSLYKFIATFLSYGTSKLQFIFSSFFLTIDQIGILGFWETTTVPFALLSIALSNVLLVRVNNLYKNNKESSRIIIALFNEILTYILVPSIGLLCTFIAKYPEILDLVTNNKYDMIQYWPVFVFYLISALNSLLEKPTFVFFLTSKKLFKFSPIVYFFSSLSAIFIWIFCSNSLSLFVFPLGIMVSSLISNFLFQSISLFHTKCLLGKHYFVQIIFFLLIFIAVFSFNRLFVFFIIVFALILIFGIYHSIRKIRKLFQEEIFITRY